MSHVENVTCCGVDVDVLVNDLNAYKNPRVSGLNAEKVLNVLLNSKDMSALSATYAPIASIKSDLKRLKLCNQCRQNNDTLSHCSGYMSCTGVHEQIARDIDLLTDLPDKYPVFKTTKVEETDEGVRVEARAYNPTTFFATTAARENGKSLVSWQLKYLKAMLEYPDATNDCDALLKKQRRLAENSIYGISQAMFDTSRIKEAYDLSDSSIVKEFNRSATKSFCSVKSIEQSADHMTVVVLWADGDKTIVKRSENDPDDIYMAFTAALAKKIYGSNSAIKREISKKLNEHKAKERRNDT